MEDSTRTEGLNNLGQLQAFATSAALQVKLLYCFGEEADTVLLSYNITEEEREIYNSHSKI